MKGCAARRADTPASSFNLDLRASAFTRIRRYLSQGQLQSLHLRLQDLDLLLLFSDCSVNVGQVLNRLPRLLDLGLDG